MGNNTGVWLTAAFAAVLCLAGCSDRCESGSAFRDMSEQEAQKLKVMMPWTTESITCRIPGYTLMAPTKGGSQGAVIGPGGTTVFFWGPRSVALTNGGEVLVSIDDHAASGRVDSISYGIVDPTDGQKYSVTDADADGRLDTKIGDHGGFVNINGKWCLMEKRAGQLGAHVDGKWEPLEKRGHVWLLQAQ